MFVVEMEQKKMRKKEWPTPCETISESEKGNLEKKLLVMKQEKMRLETQKRTSETKKDHAL